MNGREMEGVGELNIEMEERWKLSQMNSTSIQQTQSNLVNF